MGFRDVGVSSSPSVFNLSVSLCGGSVSSFPRHREMPRIQRQIKITTSVLNNTNNSLRNSEGQSENTQLLELSQIQCDCGTQVRVAIDESTVTEYAEAISQGVALPDVIVFFDGSRHMLADGFHRFMAESRLGHTHIRAEVRLGTKSDALKYALSANISHGLRRTNADKRRSVELALAEWPEFSDRRLAAICGVSNNFVSEVRRQVSSDDTCQPIERLGSDGKKYPSRTAPSLAETPTSEPISQPQGTTESSVSGEPSSGRQNWLGAPSESESTAADLKSQVEFHLNLVRADAEIVLNKIKNDFIEPAELGDCAVQLRLAAKTVVSLQAFMEWPEVKQVTSRN